MRIVLVLLCLASSFTVNYGANLENADDAPVRLPRRFLENSRTRRLHIKNQTGFDGKVEKIHVNSEEPHPRIRAYGLPKRQAIDNGHIDRSRQNSDEEFDDGSRNVRSIEAYGKSKDHLETNGQIERVQSQAPSSYQVPGAPSTRLGRSIETEPKQEVRGAGSDVEEMEAQDAKVFRPLFVYRQQQAKKQQRARNQISAYQPSEIYYGRRVIY